MQTLLTQKPGFTIVLIDNDCQAFPIHANIVRDEIKIAEEAFYKTSTLQDIKNWADNQINLITQ